MKNPIMFQAAYQPKAPCGLNALSMAGQVSERIKLKNQQQQGSAAKFVNREKGRQGKHPVEHTETPRCNKGVLDGETRVQEDGGRIVRDDVDSAELLHEHADPRANGTVSVSSHGDHLLELGEERAAHFSLLEQQNVRVECVSGGLQRGVSHLDQRVKRIPVSAFTHEPSWGLWTERNLGENHKRRQARRSQHQTPVQTLVDPMVRNRVERNTEHVSQHDTKSGPDLPVHHKRTSDSGRSTLGRVHRHSGGVWSHGETKEESGDKQMPPVIHQSRPDTAQGSDDTAQEDHSSSRQLVVQPIRAPHRNTRTTQVRSTVDQSVQPGVVVGLGADSQTGRVVYVCTVDHGLIHTLHTSGHGRCSHQPVQSLWQFPWVVDLVVQGVLLRFG
ncbi:hypothetical protein OGAPHI_004732 [Ogataea philodendri]|uniref:Uncharacterized protein n=1 Tax=Ogataea philodendri TaxID=1378263 RepID=A0A9P8P1W3_9ASCO|nr:uncharacterized protein OGAPHI_004732 [Ogataea philodendri]KAH3664018.1 hypothetical protein OGAPHI_004732 [Ogataea philodendri]